MNIELDENGDFEIKDNVESALIYVKGFAVVISQMPSGMVVDVYARGREFCETLGRCHVSDALAQKERDEGL